MEILQDDNKTLQKVSPSSVSIGLHGNPNNPYSVTNMIKAYAYIKTNGDIEKAKSLSRIKASHYYVKFTPVNDKELGLLKMDSTLNLYIYPMDVLPENFNLEEYKKQMSLSGQGEVYYASVPISYKFPQISYTILEELFIPDENKNNSILRNVAKKEVASVPINELVDRSLILTKNNTDAKGQVIMASSWTPSGRIRAWDNTVGSFVGIEGIRVSAKRWFTTYTGFTDSNGNFVCDGSFERQADYSFDWERYDFEIRDGAFNKAGERQSNLKGPWYADYGSGTATAYYATIFRAAFYYYYRDIDGLRRPPENGFWQTQLKYRAHTGTNPDDPNVTGYTAPWKRFLGLGSAIQIYNSNRPTDRIYGTTIHETAHASHWNINSSDYNNSEDYVSESWARGVEWRLTRMVYPNYDAPYFRTSYTGLVEDLVDGVGMTFTATAYYNGNFNNIAFNFPDNVEGYTMRQIEDALVGQRTKIEWRDKIVSLYNNPTEDNVEGLFRNWDILVP